jgi:hypothetical protein
MNKEFFQKLFCKDTGHAYQFLGTVPDGISLVEHVTVQFVTAANNTQLNTVVVTLSDQGMTVIYADDLTPVESELFSLITDLIPEPVPVEEPVEIVPTDEESTPPLEG